MADTDVWALGSILSPAATDRVPIATGSGAGGHSLRSEFVYADADGKFIHNGASPNYSVNFADANPSRGIIADLANNAGSSLNGAMLSFTQNTINNWCIGQAPGVDAFAIYVGRNSAADGTEVLRITPGGAVGIGTTSPGVRLHVKSGSGQIVTLETTNARGTGNIYFGINDATGRKGFIGYGGGNDDLHFMNELSGQVGFGTNGTFRWAIDSSGNFYAVTDNAYSMGKAGNRISVVYAATSTISTSDERLKVWIGRASEDRATKDRRIARAILDELGWYQFTDAVTEKGRDGARWHFGARAQRIWQIVADEGLAPPLVDVDGTLLPDITWTGPVSPAWLCFDGWNEQIEVREDGDATVVREAGHLFGFRVDEMNLLLSWALHDRLSALEEITAA